MPNSQQNNLPHDITTELHHQIDSSFENEYQQAVLQELDFHYRENRYQFDMPVAWI